jgi:hypothetical protein
MRDANVVLTAGHGGTWPGGVWADEIWARRGRRRLVLTAVNCEPLRLRTFDDVADG